MMSERQAFENRELLELQTILPCIVQKFMRSAYESQQLLEFTRSASADMLSPIKLTARNSANQPITKIHQLFIRDLALENDYQRQEHKRWDGRKKESVPS